MLILKKKLEINSRNLVVVINHLNSCGGASRLVGGAVRDALLSMPSSDLDIATSHTPQRVIEILNSQNIKTIPTGIKFGTVTAIIGDESFEITTLRKDIDCNGRHAVVEYSDDFQEDAARRDFTINALSYCPIEEKIFDYFDGIRDIDNRKVKFIGAASKRIKEDYLRILRFFRFSARYAKEVDRDGLDACIEFKKKLNNISKERIKSEMDSLLSCSNSPIILKLMSDKQILREILPGVEYDINIHQNALSCCADFGISPSLDLLYSILFYNNIKQITIPELLGLKFSRRQATNIIKMHAILNFDSEDDLILALKNIWLEEKDFVQYFMFASVLVKNSQSVCDLLRDLMGKDIPVFPVFGNDLLAIGYYGQDVGRILHYLKKEWIKSNFLHDKSFLLNMVLEGEK